MIPQYHLPLYGKIIVCIILSCSFLFIYSKYITFKQGDIAAINASQATAEQQKNTRTIQNTQEMQNIKKAQKKTLASSFILDNGLTIIAIPNHKISAVTHMLWYKVGAANELPGKSGFAHLFEHLMFKATSNHKDGEFTKLISQKGGNNNAFTSQDYTAYHQTIAKEHLEMVMGLEADRMKNLQLTNDVVTKEVDVVLEERSMRVDNNPRSILGEKINAALFSSHPYGTPVIGWRNEIEQLSLADSADFYRTYYNPNNAILVVSGDIELDELKILAQKHYGNIPAQKIIDEDKIRANIRAEVPAITEHNVKLVDHRVQEPLWVKSYIAPSQSYGQKQHATPLVLLSNILGGGEIGRLYKALVEEQKIAVSAAVYYDNIAKGPSALRVYVAPSRDKDGKYFSFDVIEKAVAQEIAKITSELVTTQELLRVKNSITAEYIYSQDGIKSLAYIYGELLATGMEMSYIDNWQDNIISITSQQIQDAAKYLFNDKKSVTAQLVSK